MFYNVNEKLNVVFARVQSILYAKNLVKWI